MRGVLGLIGGAVVCAVLVVATAVAQTVAQSQSQSQPALQPQTQLQPRPQPALAATAVVGQDLFRARCGMCHLQGGTGTFMLGRRLGAANALLAERTNLDAAYVKQIVRTGIVSMPRITRAEVSDAELQAIADYLTRKRASEAK